MSPKENITVTQKFLHYKFKINLGVHDMHEIGIYYVIDNDVESNIHK